MNKVGRDDFDDRRLWKANGFYCDGKLIGEVTGGYKLGPFTNGRQWVVFVTGNLLGTKFDAHRWDVGEGTDGRRVLVLQTHNQTGKMLVTVETFD